MANRILNQRPDPARNIKFFLQIIMSLAYLGSGAFLWFHPGGRKVIAPEYITITSVVLIVYGVFRLIRAYLTYSKPRNFFG